MTTNTPNPAPNPTPSPALNPFQAGRALLKEFQEKFTVFRDCMPLAIGIDKQLMARLPELNRRIMRTALGIHTNSMRYLRAMEKATVRFDLDGNTTDEVTETHRAHAAKVLQERVKKEADNRKAQRKLEEAQRKAEAAQRALDEAAAQRTEKLNQLTAKFSRR